MNVQDSGETLPTVSSKRVTQFAVNPQVSELIQKFDGVIDTTLSYNASGTQANGETENNALMQLFLLFAVNANGLGL